MQTEKFSNYDFNTEEIGFESNINEQEYKYYDAPEENKVTDTDYRQYSLDTVHPLVGFIKKVKLEEIELSDYFVLPYNMDDLVKPIVPNGELTINLNGKTIVGGQFTESNGEFKEGTTDSFPFMITKGNTLTIEGDGEVKAQNAQYSMAVYNNGGKVTIKGGKFSNQGDGCDLIYASNGGEIEIYGGEFFATERSGEVPGTKNKYSALNLKDKTNSKIIVYGGKFYGFDPANNVSEGPNTNFVAEGYKSIELGEENGRTIYEVVKETIDEIEEPKESVNE